MSDARALLLTDIVDSTRIAGELGDPAAARLGATHDRVARDLLQAWRGREIDKTDGMLMLFDSAADAVGYALAYHRALDNLEPALQARAGIHVGPVNLRTNPAADVARGAKPLEVEGVAKAMAARVMSLALGGQTLLTADARSALGPTALRLQSHGHWRMKGLAEPVELFETGDATAPFMPPPDTAKVYRVVMHGDLWLPARQIRHSLPAERDSFVGRHEPLMDLARRFDAGARLVSLLGIGGTGKTRLATRFGWGWMGDFPGGVWFCDLSQARGIDGILHAVAQGLAVPLGKDEPVAQLGRAIDGRGACLVVLDNFEQVSRHAEETLGQWLDRAAEARFLVTSREVLGLSGEEALALAPLGAVDAAALFDRRATSAARDFRPSSEDRATVAQLVKLLDGLPLAIELAAARARIMPPKALLARMDQRFRLLAAAGGRQDRQATLRAAFDWSWDLLSAAERAAFAQLSVFEGGFTLEAAEAVLALSDPNASHWTPDLVQSLVDKSFVRRLAHQRFDLLGSVQEYAAEHLRTPGRYPDSGPEALAAAQCRHYRYFAEPDVNGSGAEAVVDLDNTIVACRRSAARGDRPAAIGALDRAWAALRLRGPYRIGWELAAVVDAIPGLEGAERARTGRVAGAALLSAGNVAAAQARFDVAIAVAREAGERTIEGKLSSALADLYAIGGRLDEARALFETALAVARETADRGFECEVLNGFGNLAVYRGDGELARSHYLSALAVAQEAADGHWKGRVLGNLGMLDAEQGHMDAARASFEATLTLAREFGLRQLEANELCNLGLLHQSQDRLPQARDHLVDALALARDLGDARLESIVRCNLGMVCEAERRADDALAHFESALSVARHLGDQRSEGQFLGYLGLLHARQGRFAQAQVCLAHGEELLVAVADRVSLAILTCGRAEAECLAGSHDAALGALAKAERLSIETAAGPDSELGIALSSLRDLMRANARKTATMPRRRAAAGASGRVGNKASRQTERRDRKPRSRRGRAGFRRRDS